MAKGVLDLRLQKLQDCIGKDFHLYQIDDIFVNHLNCESIFDSNFGINNMINHRELKYTIRINSEKSIFITVEFELIENNKEKEYPIIEVLKIGTPRQGKMLLGQKISNMYMYE